MTDYSRDYCTEERQVREAVERALTGKFDQYSETEIRQAGKYAVLGGGHRWRAIAVVAAGRVFREDAFDINLPGACAVELAHAASLVLDDLPSMDDGKIRRGKPCTHLAFPSWVVDMTPSFLVTMGFAIILENDRSSLDRRVAAAVELSNAGTAMAAGQAIDIKQEYPRGPAVGLLECYELKSAVLYSAAAKMGALLCGASQDDCERIGKTGLLLGLSYQLMDDLADVTATPERIGKDVAKDVHKLTAVDMFGIDGVKRQSREYQGQAIDILQRYGPEAAWLRTLIKKANCEHC